MKTRRRKGFTLVETLMAALILALLTGVIATGTSVGVRIYGESLFVSESGLLASTVDTALGDILRYARSDGGGTIENPDYGIYGGHFAVPETGEHAGRILIAPRETGDAENLVLISDGAYTNLRVRDFDLTYDEGVFSGGYTISDLAGTRTREITFAFRSLTA